MTLRYSTDIVVFGGGVAGLWLLNQLRSQGYQAVLLETGELGGGQTTASQGIIHGGLKYALGGVLSGAAQAIAAMPQRWRESLTGQATPDLSAVRVLSEHYYMWSDAGVRSRLKAFLGSKSLRGRVEAVPAADYPEVFRTATVAGQLYRLPDFVIDTPSLVAALAEPQLPALFRIDATSVRFGRGDEGNLDTVQVSHGSEPVSLTAKRFVFTAGAGNEQLINAAGLLDVHTQRRPLHMVYVRGSTLPALQVHCIGDSFSLTPKLTVTSHRGPGNEITWYLGGEIAESGTGRDSEAQIEAAKALTGELFPWVDFGGARWHSFAIDRAEPAVSKQFRPDDAALVSEANALVAWPTKLTLAPVLADKVLAMLHQQGVSAGPAADLTELRTLLPQPAIARSPWEAN